MSSKVVVGYKPVTVDQLKPGDIVRIFHGTVCKRGEYNAGDENVITIGKGIISSFSDSWNSHKLSGKDDKWLECKDVVQLKQQLSIDQRAAKILDQFSDKIPKEMDNSEKDALALIELIKNKIKETPDASGEEIFDPCIKQVKQKMEARISERTAKIFDQFSDKIPEEINNSGIDALALVKLIKNKIKETPDASGEEIFNPCIKQVKRKMEARINNRARGILNQFRVIVPADISNEKNWEALLLAELKKEIKRNRFDLNGDIFDACVKEVRKRLLGS